MYSSVIKKGTFICDLIMERYIYLRNTQKQLKITNYDRNKSFLEFYLVHNRVCLKLLGSILYKLEILHLYVLRWDVDFASQLSMF